MTKSRTQSVDPNRHPQTVITQRDFDRLVVMANQSTPEKAIAAIGLRRVLEVFGIDNVVKFCIEEYGIDEVIKVMLENHRQRASDPGEPLTVGVLPPPTPRAE